MRFERRDTATACEFWAYDVPGELREAIEHVGWDPRRPEGRPAGWCRSFEPGAHLLGAAFDNLPERMEPMLRQAADLDPVPWAEALSTVCERFTTAGIDWWLTGSAALAVRGAQMAPHDLDLVVSGPDSRRAGDVLADGLIEPVTGAEWHLSQWWGRAFLEARVEWAGGVTAAADEPEASDFGATAAAALETLRWRDWEVRVPPLHLQRAVSQRRGLHDRVALIDRMDGR